MPSRSAKPVDVQAALAEVSAKLDSPKLERASRMALLRRQAELGDVRDRRIEQAMRLKAREATLAAAAASHGRAGRAGR